MGDVTREDQQKQTLARIVFEGWVKRTIVDSVIIEIDTKEGPRDIQFKKEDFTGEILPEVGKVVRYMIILESAPDLESDPSQEVSPLVGYQRLESLPGRPGHYRIEG